MSFYNAACTLDPNKPDLNWWGYYDVTTYKEFRTAQKYYADADKGSRATPEESFMFLLLFVALAEGERFNRRPNVRKLVKGQKYLIQVNCLTQYEMATCKSARSPPR